jgi:hypothetical protein
MIRLFAALVCRLLALPLRCAVRELARLADRLQVRAPALQSMPVAEIDGGPVLTTPTTFDEALQVVCALRRHADLADAFRTPVALFDDHPIPLRRSGASIHMEN